MVFLWCSLSLRDLIILLLVALLGDLVLAAVDGLTADVLDFVLDRRLVSRTIFESIPLHVLEASFSLNHQRVVQKVPWFTTELVGRTRVQNGLDCLKPFWSIL